MRCLLARHVPALSVESRAGLDANATEQRLDVERAQRPAVDDQRRLTGSLVGHWPQVEHEMQPAPRTGCDRRRQHFLEPASHGLLSRHLGSLPCWWTAGVTLVSDLGL